MKKLFIKSLVAAVAGAGLMASSALALPIINYNNSVIGAPGNTTLTTPEKDAVVWNFDGDVLTAGKTYKDMFTVTAIDTGAIVKGSTAKNAAPYVDKVLSKDETSYADQTDYLTVPTLSSNGYVSIALKYASTYLGLFWGSIDDYNSITFYLNNVATESYNGTFVTNPNAANGNQTSPYTNTYVNFYNLKPFDSFKLSSSNYAFELDNLAVVPIPEPGVTLLFGLGVAGFAGVIRRKKAFNA